MGTIILMTEKYHLIETVGHTQIAVDKETHEITLMIKTQIGMLTQSMSPEKATQLGVELIRAGGMLFNFATVERKERIKNDATTDHYPVNRDPPNRPDNSPDGGSFAGTQRGSYAKKYFSATGGTTKHPGGDADNTESDQSGEKSPMVVRQQSDLPAAHEPAKGNGRSNPRRTMEICHPAGSGANSGGAGGI